MRASNHNIVIDLLVAAEPETHHHVMRWTYGNGGIYAVPRTMDGGVDTHLSYHPDGRRHSKLTRGRLGVYPPGTILGIAIPHLRPRQEVVEWRNDGVPFESVRGVIPFFPQPSRVVNILALTQGYPIIHLDDLDPSERVLIDPTLLRSPMVSIEAWLVEPGVEATVLQQVATSCTVQYWHEAPARIHLESSHLFTGRTPWFAVTVCSRLSNT